MEYTPISAPRGTKKSCLSWHTEAALRMLQNNLDEQVGENPRELIVYGGTGKADRNWESYYAIVESLKKLKNDETLLIQSGKPVGIFKTHPYSPRVLLANSLLVPDWANWEKFRELEKLGLIMFGQMTAGSWIYIGTQGILQGTYETLSAVAKKHFNGSLAGKFILTGGMGGMGGAQPLAATMNEGAILIVEVDQAKIKRRMANGYCDKISYSLDEALEQVLKAKEKRQPLSVGLVGNCAEVLPEIFRRKIIPDVVTDQTSAHDELNGYVPAGFSLDEALGMRKENPSDYIKRSFESMLAHVQAMLDFKKAGAIVFDYGNNLRGQALKAGLANAFDYPGFVPAYIRPLFCEGKGPFRWVAL